MCIEFPPYPHGLHIVASCQFEALLVASCQFEALLATLYLGGLLHLPWEGWPKAIWCQV